MSHAFPSLHYAIICLVVRLRKRTFMKRNFRHSTSYIMNLLCPATSFHVEEYVTSMLWTSPERPQQEQNQRPGVDRWKKPVEAHCRQSFNIYIYIDLSQLQKCMEALTFTTSNCSARGREGLCPSRWVPVSRYSKSQWFSTSSLHMTINQSDKTFLHM